MFNKIALTYNRIERGVIIISSGICILIALFGFLMGIVAIIFCDYGPTSACIRASLIIEGVSVLLLSISILIIIAALRKEKPLAWYVRVFPLFPLILLILIFVPAKSSSPGELEQGNATHVGKCALPVLDGGDGLETTGCGVLEAGVIATGIISSTSEAHNWQFSAKSTAQITFTVEHHGYSCSQISILDSNGRVIESFEKQSCIDLGSGMITTSYEYFDPPNKGTYILRIIAPEAPGAYWLKIE